MPEYIRHWSGSQLTSIPAVVLFLSVAAALCLAACSRGTVPAQDLLLGHLDFGGQAVLESDMESTETADGSPAVQVILTGPGFKILESPVLFESAELERTTLAGIKQGQAALGVPSETLAGFQDVTGIKIGSLGTEATATLFFVQGRALVSLSVAGPDRAEQIWGFAEISQAKASQQ